MDEILNAMLGGMDQQQGGATGANNDAIADMLGSILGGAQQPSGNSGAQSDPMADILGSIMGGSQNAQGSAGIMGLIGALMGGGQGAGSPSGAGATNPLVQMLADKIGIPPELAQMIVGFFMAKMMGSLTQQQQPSQANEITSGPNEQMLDLDDLLQFAGDKRALQTRFANSGMTQELAAYANIDEETAERSLEALVGIVEDERATQAIQPVQADSADLKNLLDSWD
jgi:hypothetical protein